jgi:hypothetical protein
LHMEKQSQQRRVTQHPSFHNISFREAERMIRKMDQVFSLFSMFLTIIKYSF